MDIETLATSTLTNSIAQTDIMQPFFNEVDRGPVYDGHVCIYKDKSKRKAGLKTVHVQIKGKVCDKQGEETINYPVSVADLESFLNNSGCMFFVVYIDREGQKKTVYYSALTIIKLRFLLNALKDGQKTKTVKFQRFPDDNYQKTRIFLNFYEHMQMQTSFAHAKLYSEEELIKNGLLESISITAVDYGPNPSVISPAFFEQEQYAYAHIKGAAIPQPLEQIVSDIHISEVLPYPVSINGSQYYNEITRTQAKDAVSLTIGECLTISIKAKIRKMNITVRPCKNLGQALIDLPFLLKLASDHNLSINGVLISLDGIEQILTPENIVKIKNKIEKCLLLEQLFKRLKISSDFDLSSMNKMDKVNAGRLIEGLINGNVVKGLNPETPYVAKIDFVGRKIALIFKPGEEPGSFYLDDFFTSKQFYVYHMLDNGEQAPTSRFVRLFAEDFLQIANIDYDAICQSFLDYAEEEYCFAEANNLLLQMLLAYDCSHDQRTDLLDKAKMFVDTVLRKTASSEEDNRILLLNDLQIEKRQHSLSQDQMKQLVRLSEETTFQDKQTEYTTKVGINLLLDNQVAAHYYFNLLNSEDQEAMRKFPVFRFWKESDPIALPAKD